MTIERLEELTREYLQKMQSRVNTKIQDKESKDLAVEYEKIVRKFVNISPVILEKYSKYFEFNPMHEEIELSSTDAIQKIYERITIIKRGLQEGKEVDEVKQREGQQEHIKENVRRQFMIKETLQETFKNIEQEMRKREVNIDWDSLRVYCNRIISHHTETIEQDVFKKNEDDIIREEVESYIQEIEQELNNEKNEDMHLEFTDGPICPVVTDTSKFAKANRQIVDDMKEQENSQGEKNKEHYNLELPGDAIE